MMTAYHASMKNAASAELKRSVGHRKKDQGMIALESKQSMKIKRRKGNERKQSETLTQDGA